MASSPEIRTHRQHAFGNHGLLLAVPISLLLWAAIIALLYI